MFYICYGICCLHWLWCMINRFSFTVRYKATYVFVWSYITIWFFILSHLFYVPILLPLKCVLVSKSALWGHSQVPGGFETIREACSTTFLSHNVVGINTARCSDTLFGTRFSCVFGTICISRGYQDLPQVSTRRSPLFTVGLQDLHRKTYQTPSRKK